MMLLPLQNKSQVGDQTLIISKKLLYEVLETSYMPRTTLNALFIGLCNPHNNPIIRNYYSLNLTNKETEAERVTCSKIIS